MDEPSDAVPDYTYDRNSRAAGLVVFIAQRLVSIASQVARRQFSVGVPEWRLMLNIAAHPTVTGAELAAVTGMDKAAVSRGLQRLTSDGLVQELPVIGRRQPITLTERGRALALPLREAAHDFERRMLRGLSPEEAERLIAALRVVSGNVETMDTNVDKV